MAGDALSDFISTGAGAVAFSLAAYLLIVFRAGLGSKAAGQYERVLPGPLRAGPGALARPARFWQGVYLIGGIGAAVLGVVFCAGFLAQCLMAVRGQLRGVQPAAGAYGAAVFLAIPAAVLVLTMWARARARLRS